MKPLVYVAAPYTRPDPVWNTNKAINVGLDLVETGKVAVLVPHLTLLAHMVRPQDEQYWYDLDLDQLAHCDALLRLPGASTGADKEVQFAVDNDIPVFGTVDALMSWVDTQPVGRLALKRKFERAAKEYKPTVLEQGPDRRLHVAPEPVGDDGTVLPKEVDDAMRRIAGTFRSKGKDYTGKEPWDFNFQQSALQTGTSPLTIVETMIAVKQTRLRSLAATGKKPENESVFDTILDRAVYSVIALALAIQEAAYA